MKNDSKKKAGEKRWKESAMKSATKDYPTSYSLYGKSKGNSFKNEKNNFDNRCKNFGKHMARAARALDGVIKPEEVGRYLSSLNPVWHKAPVEIIWEEGEKGLHKVMADIVALSEGLFG